MEVMLVCILADLMLSEGINFSELGRSSFLCSTLQVCHYDWATIPEYQVTGTGREDGISQQNTSTHASHTVITSTLPPLISVLSLCSLVPQTASSLVKCIMKTCA